MGAANSDPELLTRLLRQSLYLPDKSDVLAEGKKVVPVEVLATAYENFLDRNNPPPISVTSKGGKNKGKGKYGVPIIAQKPKWPTPAPEVNGFDLLMLPHPEVVNRDEETYVVQGPLTYKTRVTKENWDTLRFNTKTMSPEYFPSSYLSPFQPFCRRTKTGAKRRSYVPPSPEPWRTFAPFYWSHFCPSATRSPRMCIGR